jgi:GAF domain-containing protein
VRQLRAPAAAVLVPRGRRLVAAASAGDWALARRIQREHDAATAPPGAQPPAAASPHDREAEPPEFPVDDVMPRLLALYPRAVPFERWHELADVPPALLPLVALADRGAAVAVALRHRQRLAGLWVLARRAGDQAYTDAELGTLERLAQQAGPALAKALAGDE